MTREEAITELKRNMWKQGSFPYDDFNRQIINKIFNDFENREKELQELLVTEYPKGYEDARKEFESRTCDNCKDFSDGFGNCTIAYNYMDMNFDNILTSAPKDFNCSKWKQK